MILLPGSTLRLSLTLVVGIAATSFTLAPAARSQTMRAPVPSTSPATPTKLRTISPQKGRMVRPPKVDSLKGGGVSRATCCTHWNTSTGGTGCATYPDTCPDNTFTVDCGPTGCW